MGFSPDGLQHLLGNKGVLCSCPREPTADLITENPGGLAWLLLSPQAPAPHTPLSAVPSRPESWGSARTHAGPLSVSPEL